MTEIQENECCAFNKCNIHFCWPTHEMEMENVMKISPKVMNLTICKHSSYHFDNSKEKQKIEVK